MKVIKISKNKEITTIQYEWVLKLLENQSQDLSSLTTPKFKFMFQNSIKHCKILCFKKANNKSQYDLPGRERH